MKNHWIQTDQPIATWLMDLRRLVDAPDDLLALVLRVLELGNEYQVYRCSSSDAEDVATYTRRRWREDHVLELFRRRAGDTSSARMSWFDRDGNVVDGHVDDLARLRRQLEPTAESMPRGFRTLGEPPVRFFGLRIEYEGAPSVPARRDAEVAVYLHSDIWFPFVHGAEHPWADYKRWFDNRELALQHTPRLNRFLGELRALVTLAGGAWKVDDSECHPRYRQWIGPDGIQLDGPVPELMPPGAEDVTWPDS
ncbi:MAG: hypothetical protein H6709_08985 [Kofleriaceae bacterium]|nr:hypothetical protein [Myxococcales bacterium]MCB9565146.1 hypothetical protein [Kofleriaceae bacterium]MCB9572205.1 hypothetical protein [Kofleriaceae bacterium]